MDSHDEKREPVAAKKPYRSPVIQVYGDIRAITKAVGQSNNADGGMQPKNNTGV